jgi:hypothetical protein
MTGSKATPNINQIRTALPQLDFKIAHENEADQLEPEHAQ